MKIKKWKELLTGIALVGAITPAISLSVNKNNTTQTTTSLSVLKNTSSKTTVDYSLVEKMMSNLNPKLLRSNLSENKLTPEQEQKARELQEQYLNLFKINNYSLEEIQSYMCENFPQYKEEYEKQMKNLSLNYISNKNNSFATIQNKNFLQISPDIEEWIKRKQKEFKDKIPNLEHNRDVLIGWCATASTLAAGFYAAAFWTFGATIPWAVACTTAATQLGILQDFLYKQICIIKEYVEVNFLYALDYIEKLEEKKNETLKNLNIFQIVCDALIALIWIGGPLAIGIKYTCDIIIKKVLKTLIEVFVQHFCDIINIFLQ